jgi:hypothetical protein
MTREEAILILNRNVSAYLYGTKWSEALEIAIKALEQEPCEDCISRENLLKAFKDECRGECDNCPNFRKVDREYKCRLIADFPPVTPKEKTGWIPVSEKLPETNDDVLVTDGVDMFVAWYSRKGMWQGWMSSDNNFERNTPIEAWMPLPLPWKGE